MTELLDFASNNGFAIVISIYMLVRMETTIKELTKVVTVLSVKMGANVNE